MTRRFVNFRRKDAAGYAGRIEHELERRCGDAEVLRDVNDIASGKGVRLEIRVGPAQVIDRQAL